MRLRGLLMLFAALFLMVAPLSQATTTATWSHYAGHGPYVMVEDHTGVAWPVKAGVYKWSYGLRYGPCKTSQCVKVYEANWGRNGVVGTDSRRYSGTLVIGATIRLNDAYSSMSYANRLQTTMHELGHSLGLPHDTYKDCMHASIQGYDTISSYERGELTKIYAH